MVVLGFIILAQHGQGEIQMMCVSYDRDSFFADNKPIDISFGTLTVNDVTRNLIEETES